MTFQHLLSTYSLGSTVILIFLSLQTHRYRKWYRVLLINPDAPLRVQRFFLEMEPVFQRFYPLLDRLKCRRGRPATDYRFQFRWMVWWKFFGPQKLQQALRTFNQSQFLPNLLRAPSKLYSREIFHSFRKKLGDATLERMQALLIQWFEHRGLLDWGILIVDSFPVKSFLNTVKCLKIPPINYEHLAQFLATVSVQPVLERLRVSPRYWGKMQTKVLALLVKAIWDLPSWRRCWKVLYGSKTKARSIQLPYSYKTSFSLKSIETLLAKRPDRAELERLLVTAARQALLHLQLKPATWAPKTLAELNGCWHTPHRWRDPGISLYYCAAKHSYEFGRGGLLAILPGLELPLMVELTPKYKQSEISILNFFGRLKRRYGRRLQGVKVLGDSEFGLHSIRQAIQELYQGAAVFPNYGTRRGPGEISKADRTLRKMVDRVIGRLDTTWHMEAPRHLGAEFAGFHLRVCVLCDLLQVVFNLHLGNGAHPHPI
ncbi:MAG: hypothetical protein ACE5I5_17420, partial [Candidatus Heimdallarchaeota archaeon]